ncbi:butyrophilin-like protein 1 isoform X2 [Lates calcarifer]|uniref:Butyrophilin-like protein 1 isoform X2 n=1 Tax=Lates calcarifer TaxID=8187 RepID=A0AAJ8B1N8_LATCA|nr:butyrophilin-like protein 1 isoform X2 [Lates calcarifer]
MENASIIIRHTKLTDSGNYICDFPGRQTSHIQLVVDGPLKDRRGENIPGAAPEPYIRILGETKDGELLQCVVRGASPKPKVEWKDSSGNILPAKDPQVSERGGRYDITLQTTVTETGNYTCVSTQEEINHQIYAETFVSINGGIFNTVTIACVIVIGVLFLLVVVLAVILCRRNKQRGRY